jgi:hypothetical protein
MAHGQTAPLQLIIAGEFGYLPFKQDDANLFFQPVTSTPC